MGTRLILVEAERDNAQADLSDLVLVLARTAADNGHRMSLDDVIRAFGHTRDSLAELTDD
ncbi:MAG: hypothetical protein GEV03_16360 [Streptosporangiales bacterium]|nr:hypothetical protein [Streptosporangiales bacterium]